MASIAMLVSVLYQALPRSQFLINRLTKLPLVACRHQKISDDSPTIMYNTRVHGLLQFAWNEATLVDVR
jgi:hypothetical protein